MLPRGRLFGGQPTAGGTSLERAVLVRSLARAKGREESELLATLRRFGPDDRRAEAIRLLQEIIDGHSSEADNQAGSQVGEARDEKVAYRTVLGGQKDGTRPAPESDLAGPRNPTAQGLHELRLRKDRARNTGQESLETGDPSDLFSEARKQRDITDERESDQLREGHSVKEPTGATGRGADALHQQLELLVPEGRPAPDPARYSKLVNNVEVSRLLLISIQS